MKIRPRFLNENKTEVFAFESKISLKVEPQILPGIVTRNMKLGRRIQTNFLEKKLKVLQLIETNK